MIIAQILDKCASVAAESCTAAIASPGSDIAAEIIFPTPWLAEAERSLSVTYRADETANLGVRVNTGAGSINVDLAAPQRLQTLAVEKPWGNELWLTGIEQRGECTIRIGAEFLPLASYLALAPTLMLGEHTLPLLKVLVPGADSVRGDLYIEAHASKSELYVVSDIDEDAWPDGDAVLLLGLNQDKRTALASDDEFRAAYLNATQRYETTRRAIDSGTPGLETTEEKQRLAVRSFLTEFNVALDSVVSVPPLLPHSLQHGVRVVECQTPVFERYILSFWQRVATQDHWDTKEAAPVLSLDTPPQNDPKPISDGLTEVGRFDAFSLYRLEDGTTMELAPASSCRLVISMRGTSRIGELALDHEEAAFLPASARSNATAPLNGYLLIVCATMD